MKRNSFIIVSLAAGAMLASCRKADEIKRNPQNLLADIFATNEGNGGKRLFNPRISNDTVYFDIPYYFPEDSDDETDLSRIILRGSIPSDAKITPALGGFTDLRQPFRFSVLAGTGEKKDYVVIGKKVGNTTIENIKVTFRDVDGATQEIDGVVQETGEVLFYVMPGTVMNDTKISYVINKHTAASIPQDGPVDLAQPAPFVLTGKDGVAKTYTLKTAEPVKLAYGFGINRKLWSKSATELNYSANNEICLAVSGDYLVITRRTNPSKYSVYNRFTGTYVREMVNPLGSQLSFQMIGDDAGNLLGASWAPKNAKFILHKYKNPMDAAPVKLIEWTNNNPAAIPGDGGVGRRVNIYGNLDGNAVIMAPAGVSNIIYKWRVNNGAVVSQVPEVINFPSLANGAANFGFYAEAQPVSAEPNANYWINYQFDIALINGTSHQRIAAFANDPAISGIFHMPTAVVNFNNASYLAILKYVETYSLNKVHLSVFDVTNPSKIGTPFADPSFKNFNVFNSEQLTAPDNGNGTGDVAVGFSDNNQRMRIYYLLTNGGVRAHEFTVYAP